MQEQLYHVYMTDAMKAILETIAQIGGMDATVERYYSIIHPKPEEKRTKDEIINVIKSKIEGIDNGGDSV